MNILRAHDYEIVEAARNEISYMPEHWQELVANLPLILLPNNISPIWIGLMAEERITHDGRKYSETCGWYCPSDVDENWKAGPYIYWNGSSVWSVIHEMAHAIEDILNVPISELFEPEKALYPYMASNEQEFFACAIDAFLQPAQNKEVWNIDHLYKTDAKIFDYLMVQIQ